jgi:hypothetical protein
MGAWCCVRSPDSSQPSLLQANAQHNMQHAHCLKHPADIATRTGHSFTMCHVRHNAVHHCQRECLERCAHPTAYGTGRLRSLDTVKPMRGMMVYCSVAPSATSHGRRATCAKSCRAHTHHVRLLPSSLFCCGSLCCECDRLALIFPSRPPPPPLSLSLSLAAYSSPLLFQPLLDNPTGERLSINTLL